MLVCDECRDINIPCLEFNLIIEKPPGDDGKGRKKPGRSRQVVCIPLTVCDPCMSKVLRNLGRLKQRGNLSGQRKPELEEDLAE